MPPESELTYYILEVLTEDSYALFIESDPADMDSLKEMIKPMLERAGSWRVETIQAGSFAEARDKAKGPWHGVVETYQPGAIPEPEPPPAWDGCDECGDYIWVCSACDVRKGHNLGTGDCGCGVRYVKRYERLE